MRDFNHIILYTMLLFCVSLSSCSNDDNEILEKDINNIIITCQAAGFEVLSTDITRATQESGDKSLNELIVKRLALLVYKDGILLDYVKPSNYDKTQPNLPNTCIGGSKGVWNITGYIPKEYLQTENYNLYLIANYEFTDDEIESIKSEADITNVKFNKVTHNINSFTPNNKQNEFMMIQKGVDSRTTSDGTLILEFNNLKRVLSKIQIIALDGNGNASVEKLKDIKKYKLVNYAYDPKDVYWFSDKDPSSEIEPRLTTMTTGDNGFVDLWSGDAITAPYPNGTDSKDLYKDGLSFVLYSYPNYWYDNTKNIWVEEPIDWDRQTHLLIKANYNGYEFYYKIPINYRLPDNNDAVLDNLENAKKEAEEYCRLRRNHLYRVFVYIDRRGGETAREAVYIAPAPYTEVVVRPEF